VMGRVNDVPKTQLLQFFEDRPHLRRGFDACFCRTIRHFLLHLV
jgi:hypothetical protein